MDERAEQPITGAKVFALLWDNLALVLGTAATATLLRRAVKRAASRAPALAAVSITRDQWEYRYSLPASWQTASHTDLPELSDLVRVELCPLLQQFTGSIVLRRLENIPELRSLGMECPEER